MKQLHRIIPAVIITTTSLGTDPSVAEETQSITLNEVTVTATREAQSVAETPVSVGIINEENIEFSHPAHPSEVMEQIPGVHINVTGGEGHMTAIRQPISTKALYLYLEDGIPTRSTGFFNHNALYEVNLPQSGGIEVLKGPGTALYGSDAIGAVVNIQTRPAPLHEEYEVNLEAGEFGWRRLLATAGNSWGDDGLRADVNLTTTDGWRDNTDYDRQSATLRWDSTLQSGATTQTVVAVSNIDQNTAGSSRLLADDYYNNPTLNYTPISFREVDAVRVSSAYEKESSDTLLSITPYFRSNAMKILPNWSLSYDPAVWDTESYSLGMLLKYRMDYVPYNTRVIIGADIDHTPGSHSEKSIDASKTGDIYTSYVETQTIYDYDVTFQGVSPYIHTEFSPSHKLRVNAGLRYDHLSYDYDNKLSDADIVLNPLSTSFPVTYKHPSDTEVSFSRLSPKLGATYAFNERMNGFVSYRQAFRAPSESQLFRPGKSASTTDLKAVKAESYEIGLRGKIDPVRYEISVYHMLLRDDIITYEYPDKSRETMNAGKTSHQGIEAGLFSTLTERTTLDVSASYAKHTYEQWQPKSTVDYSGNEMESAPRLVANTRLGFKARILNGGKAELEWVKLGSYWMDQANTQKYSGHDILNLRINYFAGKKLELYTRLMNIADKRYATAASYKASSNSFEYAPGMPRTVYAGISYQF